MQKHRTHPCCSEAGVSFARKIQAGLQLVEKQSEPSSSGMDSAVLMRLIGFQEKKLNLKLLSPSNQN